MKKLVIGLAMVLSLALVANVALSDETVPFPYWQHGWALYSFWSISNTHATDNVTVTVEMLAGDGTVHGSTTSTIAPGQAWMPATYGTWYTFGNGYGFGKYIIDTPDETCQYDCVYVWGCIAASLADSQPGYTVILPGNPYGVPGC